MTVHVQTPNFNPTVSLIEFTNTKLCKLEQYYSKILSINVFYKVQHTSLKQNKKAEILLSVPGGSLSIKKECKTFEQALDECVQSLKRQLKKRNQKEREIN